MAEETQETPNDRGAVATLSRAPLSASTSRLNAAAPAFVPRSAAAATAAAAPRYRAAKIHRAIEPPPAAPHAVAIQAFPPAALPLSHAILVPVPNHDEFDVTARVAAEPCSAPPPEEGLPESVIRKIKKQVEYYFSDANLATTEILMRFISKDPEGFVPISVVASFKKIRALVHDNSLLAAALSTSTQLHVSDDGKKVRLKKPFTEADLEEVQSRILFAENLPENHCYQNLMKVFSAVGSVKSIRTCYPQNSDGTTAAVNRSSKNDMVLCNKVHAFVEYETIEDAKIAVNKLNGETNWRNGLRVRPLLDCVKHGTGRGRKDGHEGDDVRNGDYINTINQPNEKQADDKAPYEHHVYLLDPLFELISVNHHPGLHRKLTPVLELVFFSIRCVVIPPGQITPLITEIKVSLWSYNLVLQFKAFEFEVSVSILLLVKLRQTPFDLPNRGKMAAEGMMCATSFLAFSEMNNFSSCIIS